MEAPDPGVYQGVSFDDYARWDAANHSVLRHFAKTPAHAYLQLTAQQESTPFQALGHLIHFALLEPERFTKNGPVVAPDVDRRTTLGKKTWADFLAENEGREVVTEKQMRALAGIRKSVMFHATAREALYGFGTSELSLVWDRMTEYGTVRCKGRLDRLCEIGGHPTVLDIKTMSAAASTYSFQSSVKEYGYHQQAGFYLDGAAALVPPDEGVQRKFVWLVCETEPPYLVRMFEADDLSLDVGRQEMAQYIERYAECRAANVWPGWPEGVDLAGLPPWALKRFDIE